MHDASTKTDNRKSTKLDPVTHANLKAACAEYNGRIAKLNRIHEKAIPSVELWQFAGAVIQRGIDALLAEDDAVLASSTENLEDTESPL